MPKMSYSQEKMAYIPPAEGTIPTRHRNTKGVFGSFLDKAGELLITGTRRTLNLLLLLHNSARRYEHSP